MKEEGTSSRPLFPRWTRRILALTTVLGLLPLVLFSETADSTIWNALGYALIGGLLSSTVFVLATTPAIYLLIEGRGGRAGQVAARAPAA